MSKILSTQHVLNMNTNDEMACLILHDLKSVCIFHLQNIFIWAGMFLVFRGLVLSAWLDYMFIIEWFSIKRRHQLAQQAQVYHVHYRELGELLKQKEMGKLYLLDMLSGWTRWREIFQEVCRV